jgi:hypothetical protein
MVSVFSLDDPKFRADMFHREEDVINDDTIITSCTISVDGPITNQVILTVDNPEDSKKCKPVFNLEDLVGRSFSMDEQEDGQLF